MYTQLPKCFKIQIEKVFIYDVSNFPVLNIFSVTQFLGDHLRLFICKLCIGQFSCKGRIDQYIISSDFSDLRQCKDILTTSNESDYPEASIKNQRS